MTVRGKGDKLAEVWVPPATAECLIEWCRQYEEGWSEIRDGVPDPTVPVIVGFRNLRNWQTGDRWTVPQWGKGISQQALGRIVASRTAAAGYRITPHDMRRSFAGMMYDRGGLEKASRALRHSSLSTTEIYLERRHDAAAVAAEAVGLEL